MLVVISDLHFNDGSATRSNVPSGAFKIFLTEILTLAEQNEAKEIVLLYLGDVFDLIRTEHWFYPAPGPEVDLSKADRDGPGEFPLKHRPWGGHAGEASGTVTAECISRARAILSATIRACDQQLRLLRGDVAHLPATSELRIALDRWNQSGRAITRYYLPGNHDRLLGLDETLMGEGLAALGAKLVTDGHTYRSERYRVLARHGHEWDVWNFDAFREDQMVGDLVASSYLPAPIGDPITTELVARLPFEVRRALRAADIHPVKTAVIYDHLKSVEDVRPLAATLDWILVEAQRIAAGTGVGADLSALLTRTTGEVAENFGGIPFVRDWMDQHDRWGIDETEKLQALLAVAGSLDVGAIQALLKLADRAKGFALIPRPDPFAVGALSEATTTFQFHVFGHTHAFSHVPLACTPDGIETVYLNSGTWRPRVKQTLDRKGFVEVKEMTYLVFYAADEDPINGQNKGASYESWSGLMLKHERL